MERRDSMKKVKRSLLPIILAASVATAANADGPCPFEGFYLGLGVGDSVNTGTVDYARTLNFSVAPPGTAPITTTTRAVRSGIGGKNNIAGQVYAGYGCPVWDPVYLGVEISGKFGKNNARGLEFFDTRSEFNPVTGAFIATVRDGAAVRSKHRNWELGIDFRPGILLCPESLFYVRVGAAWNRINFHETAFVQLVSPTGTTAVVANRDRRRNNKKASLRLGVGLEQQFCECWSIRADYVYTDYRRHRHNNTATTFTVPVGFSVSGSVVEGDVGRYVATSRAKLHNHTAMLGISYYFN